MTQYYNTYVNTGLNILTANAAEMYRNNQDDISKEMNKREEEEITYEPQSKKSKFESFIEKNLPKVLKEETINSLGDRKLYIGSSDVGGCLRKSFLDKVTETEYDMATLIRFERGHISEGIVRKMLKGLDIQEQVEVKGMAHNFGLKSHIDFMIENKDECVVIEAKSVSSAIDVPYHSWILQVQYQLHLLKINKNKPVRAYIIAIDLNTGWFKAFDVSYNETLAQMALRRAIQLIGAIKNCTVPDAEEQLYCPMCPHKKSCPLMNAGVVQVQGDMEQLALDIVKLNEEKKNLEKILDAKKSSMEEFMRTANIKKVKADKYFITLSNDISYVSIDSKLLKQQKPELYDQLIGEYGKDTSRKGYIQVK